jgi:hypothetical protein
MGVLKQVVFAGIGKQAGKGSPSAAATYAQALISGHATMFTLKQEVIETTSNKPFMFDTVRKEAVPAGEFTVLAQPRSIGLLLLATLGTDTVSGGPTPYTHTITPAQDLPYLTLFGQVGGADYFTTQDCKVDELTLAFKDPGALECTAKIIGCSTTWSGSAWTITNDERGQPFFQASGGTFKLDGVSGTPVTLPVKDASVKIKRNLQAPFKASSVTPYDVYPGPANAEVQITVIADDLTQVRKVITGSSAGTAIAQALTYGSFDLFWTFDANNDLDISSGRIGWTVDLPAGDPKGGVAELVFTGTALATSATNAVTAVLHNTTASY